MCLTWSIKPTGFSPCGPGVFGARKAFVQTLVDLWSRFLLYLPFYLPVFSFSCWSAFETSTVWKCYKNILLPRLSSEELWHFHLLMLQLESWIFLRLHFKQNKISRKSPPINFIKLPTVILRVLFNFHLLGIHFDNNIFNSKVSWSIFEVWKNDLENVM